MTPTARASILLALAAGVAFAAPLPAQTALLADDPIDEPEWLRRALKADSLAELNEALADAGRPSGTRMPFNEADLFFEENATAGDLGIHFAIDHASEDAWRRVTIFFPNGERFINARAGGSEAEIGVTGLFSESAEPSYDNLPRDEFLEMFPEGEYTFVGWTINGNMLVSTDVLTHNIPLEPVSITPEEGDIVDYDRPLIIRWRRTPDPAPPESVIISYEVIVTKEQEDEPKRVISVQLLPTQRSVRIPVEFLEPDKNYKYEIVAKETSGNQTITEVAFRTEADD